MRYENFVIQITTDGRDEIALRVSESPVGESAAVIAGSDSPLGRLLEHSRASWCELDGLMAESGPERLGHLLYDALFCGSIQRRFLEAVGRSGSAGAQGLRIKLQVDFESPALAEVHALPWEVLYRVETGSFLALDRRFAVVRHLRLPVSRNLPPSPPQLKLLVVVAVPRGRQPLATDKEYRRIVATWQADGAMKARLLAHATLDRLRDRLLAEEYHGLHFIGHAELDPQTGDGLLLLEDDRGEAAPCSGRDLAIQLADRTSLRWVFLNACSTASSSTRRPFGGLAAALLRTGVPAVLAMQRPVSDRAAVVFSHTVYQRLAAGEGIDTAVSEGRLAIHRHLPGSPEWGTPVLFLRSVDGELFHRQGPPSIPPALPPMAGTGTTGSKPGNRRWIFGLVLLLTGIVGIRIMDMRIVDFSNLGRPAAESGSSPMRDIEPAGTEGGDSSTRHASGEPSAADWEAVTVREGKAAEIPAFGARASVTFDESLGTPFARLTVAFPDAAPVSSSPFMNATVVTLGQGRTLSVQSIDWVNREVLVLPIRFD